MDVINSEYFLEQKSVIILKTREIQVFKMKTDINNTTLGTRLLSLMPFLVYFFLVWKFLPIDLRSQQDWYELTLQLII
jgi:hypothetical protein